MPLGPILQQLYPSRAPRGGGSGATTETCDASAVPMAGATIVLENRPSPMSSV